MTQSHPARQWTALTPDEKREAIRLLEARERIRSRRHIDTVFPDAGTHRRELYPKHLAFMAAGAERRERCMMAANRVGKSTTAAYELACHATGVYPPWWTGRRFANPVVCWAAGQSVRDLRDSAQKLLLDGPGGRGTGMIPGDAIQRASARLGTPEAVDTIYIKHQPTGGTSTITFKTYESGREAFQAATVHVVWCDEEPPAGIYQEAMMRTMTVQGIVMCTFTPMLGLSETALKFWNAREKPAPAPYVVMVEWDDVPHLSTEDKEAHYQSIPPHLRDARTRGIPHLGAGAIYPVAEADIVEEPFDIPPWWRRVFGMDVGWKRTACVWGAIDPETDVLHLYAEYYRGEVEPVVHAAAIKARGVWIPGVIDPASRGRSQHDGEQLFNLYGGEGLRLTPADNAVESGIYKVWQRLSSGRIKVSKLCQEWLGEYRKYHRDEKGKVIKVDDHLMDATRYLVVSGIDLAQQPPPHIWSDAHQQRSNPYLMQEVAWLARKAKKQDARSVSSGYDPWGGRMGGGGQQRDTRGNWMGIGKWDR